MSIIASVLVEVIVFGALYYIAVKYIQETMGILLALQKRQLIIWRQAFDSRYVSGVCQICAGKGDQMARGVSFKIRSAFLFNYTSDDRHNV